MTTSVSNRLVIATHNAGKFREFSELLRPYVPGIVSAAELGLSSPDESGTTFAENAILKAKAAAEQSGILALADDSGLCVTALGGKPGIFSARWAEPKGNFHAAMQRINQGLEATQDRSAYFICVLALCWPDGTYECVEGRIDGTLSHEPRGKGGHGYDPIFIPNGYGMTFAEMDEDKKNKISHRGVATRALIERFFLCPSNDK
ncbi:MAG: RdgB/HAM1 family non-canonical purine NTP pyrophosphatase [Bdellovibrionales bacterium]